MLAAAAAAAAAISTPSVLRGTYLFGILTTNRRRASAKNAPSRAVSRRRHLASSHAGEVPVGFPSIAASGGASNLRQVKMLLKSSGHAQLRLSHYGVSRYA
jgi:hypothetical protein